MPTFRASAGSAVTSRPRRETRPDDGASRAEDMPRELADGIQRAVDDLKGVHGERADETADARYEVVQNRGRRLPGCFGRDDRPNGCHRC